MICEVCGTALRITMVKNVLWCPKCNKYIEPKEDGRE